MYIKLKECNENGKGVLDGQNIWLCIEGKSFDFFKKHDFICVSIIWLKLSYKGIVYSKLMQAVSNVQTVAWLLWGRWYILYLKLNTLAYIAYHFCHKRESRQNFFRFEWGFFVVSVSNFRKPYQFFYLVIIKWMTVQSQTKLPPPATDFSRFRKM